MKTLKELREETVKRVGETPDLEKMSNELLKHKSKGVDYEKAAAYVRTMFMNSSLSVQDKAMKGLLTLLKNMELTDRTTITKILKDNGFKVKGGRLMRESLDESGMTTVQKKKFDALYKKMDGGKEHKAIRQKILNPIKADDAFHALVKKMAMESVSIEEVKKKLSTADRNAMKKVNANESVELDEAFQQFLDKSPSNWGEDKVVAYGEKKGHKVIGVVGTGKVDGIVLFGLDAGDKKYVGKEAKVKTGQTVFRYATRNSMAGDLFPLIKIDVKRGLMYHLTQASSSGDVDYAEFESRSVKLKYLRFAATANLRDITGFDPGFGSMKEDS